MTPPRVAFLCHVHPWVTQTFVSDEVEHLRRHGVPLAVLAFKRPTAADMTALDAVRREAVATTTYLPPPWSPSGLAAQARCFLRSPGAYLRAAWTVATDPFLRRATPRLRLAAVLAFLRGVLVAERARRDGLLHVHADFANETATAAWTASRLAPLTFSFRNFTSFNPQALARKVRDARFVLSCSGHDRRMVLAAAGSEHAAKVHVDVLGIDLASFRAVADQPPATDLVLCVGTLQPKKGQEHLVRALALLAGRGIRMRALLVGGGPDAGRLAGLVASLGLETAVRFEPYAPRGEVRRLMAGAAVFCLPSVVAPDGDVDGIPFVLMEAMALGRPCVSTTVSGIPELIDDGVDGLLVPPADASALADALARLAADAALRSRLGAAGRAKVERSFDIERNTKRTAALFLSAARPDP